MKIGGDVFHFSKDMRIILYGVNDHAEKLYRALSDAGYRVAAYFDRRHEELNGKYPVPVYGLERHPFGDLDKDGFCVVLMLQNAMQHEPVAAEFSRQGFHHILFAPMRSRLKERDAASLRLQYNILLMGQFKRLQEIPLFKEDSLQPEIDAARAIIREEGSFKIIWCPAELLYTNPARLCREAAMLRYADVPLYSYGPYVGMFEYLRGTGGEMRQYLDEYGVNSCKYQNSLTDADVVRQRKQLLETYKDALNRGMDFFISSAPPAEWNERLCAFNLLEGQHRSLFLAMEGFRYIPIWVSREDFEKWNVSCPAEELQDHLSKNGKSPHVLHPGYNRINEDSDRNDLLQLESIQKYLGGPRNGWRGMLEGKTVLDLSGTYGYYARNALRMRAERAVLYAPEGAPAARELHALEGFPDIDTVDVWERAAGEMYHSLFVLNALADEPPDGKRAWVDRCAGLCLEECFVTVGEPAELALWERRFSKARELRALFDGKRTVRLYVLRK